MGGKMSRRRHGTAMLEMAICLPIFLLLVGGVFTIGSVYNHQMAINTAARDVARKAAVGRPDSEVIQLAYDITPNLNHDPDRFGVSVQRGARSVVAVVEYTEDVHIPVLNLLFHKKKLVARAEHFFETEFITR